MKLLLHIILNSNSFYQSFPVNKDKHLNINILNWIQKNMLAIYCSLIWRIWFQTVFNIQLQFSKRKFLCGKEKKQIKQIKCKVPEGDCYVKLILTQVKCLCLVCFLEENLWKKEMGMWKLRFWLVGYEVKERMDE
jgi:hypothetical protein